MELDLWAGFLHRRDIRALPVEQRLFLIELAVEAATIEDLDVADGFVPEVVIQYLDWPTDQTSTFLDDFTKRGWITRLEEPPGWQINGWLERVKAFTPGSQERKIPSWGQKRRSTTIQRRLNTNARQVRHREKTKSQSSNQGFTPHV